MGALICCILAAQKNMKPGTVITSTQNPKIKGVLALEKPRERKKQQLFVIEGLREIRWAIEAGYTIGNLFYCEDIISLPALGQELTQGRLVIPVTAEVFEKLAVRETSTGVVAVAEMKTHRLEDITLPPNPLLLIAEAVEKPGNLGAMLRTADAAGVDALIICDPQTDFYNPNVIRSSVGCVFTVPIAAASTADTLAWLRTNGVRILCASLQTSQPYTQIDYTRACAIVLGTEATGLSAPWTHHSDANIVIPMRGKIDSMNVSNAAAVLVFEARRQREARLS
jgi:TrmH family RNA methyltransferase